MSIPIPARARRPGRPPTRPFGVGTIALVTLALFVAFVVVSATAVNRANQNKERVTQRSRTATVIQDIDERVITYNQTLYGLRSGFVTDPQLNRRTFNEIVLDLDVEQRLPGVRLLGAAHLVAPTDVERFVESVNADIEQSGLEYPRFEIAPAVSTSDMVVVDYIEPQLENERALGFDSYSEETRRSAVEATRDSGDPIATGPIVLLSEREPLISVGVSLALYEPGALIDTVEQRQEAFRGFVFASFRIDELVRGIFGDKADGIVLADVEAEELLFGDLDGASPATLDPSDANVETFEIAGRIWVAQVDTGRSPLSTTERWLPSLVLLSGLGVAALVFILIRSIARSRRQAEEAAADTSDELDALTESANEGIISVTTDAQIVAWNEAATAIFGWTADEMLGRTVTDLLDEQQIASMSGEFSSVIDDDDSGRSERNSTTRVRRADGDVVDVELTMSRWTGQGRTLVTAFVRDITERVDAERRARSTTNLLRGVLGAATEMSIIGADTDGNVTVFNRGAERMLGFKATDVVGHRSLIDFHVADHIAMRADALSVDTGFDALVERARRGKAETRTWSYVRSDGNTVPVEVTITPRRDEGGETIGFIAIAVDITERIAADSQQQQILAQEREMVAKLIDLDKAKTDFVSTTSHELRTPLTSIIGYAELLEDDPSIAPGSPQASMLDKIGRNADRLLNLVEDLLVLSQIESGALNTSSRPCDIAKIIRSADEAVAPMAARAEITVQLELGELPLVNGDAPGLERVFLNLMSNAVKFTESGGRVVVSASEHDGGVRISVADDGIGIPADEVPQLFERFFRSSIAEDQQIQGSGLGLSIVANIVERHGGNVDVDSVEGIGTTVTITLPEQIQPSFNTNDLQEVTQ